MNYGHMLCRLLDINKIKCMEPEKWIVEPKYDGFRAFAEIKSGSVRLISRNGKDLSDIFPEFIISLKEDVKKTDCVLDGEITSSGGFEGLLSRRTEDKLKASIMSKKMPATYNIFDILLFNNEDIRNEPLSKLKELLSGVLKISERLNIVKFAALNMI